MGFPEYLWNPWICGPNSMISMEWVEESCKFLEYIEKSDKYLRNVWIQTNLYGIRLEILAITGDILGWIDKSEKIMRNPGNPYKLYGPGHWNQLIPGGYGESGETGRIFFFFIIFLLLILAAKLLYLRTVASWGRKQLELCELYLLTRYRMKDSYPCFQSAARGPPNE